MTMLTKKSKIHVCKKMIKKGDRVRIRDLSEESATVVVVAKTDSFLAESYEHAGEEWYFRFDFEGEEQCAFWTYFPKEHVGEYTWL